MQADRSIAVAVVAAALIALGVGVAYGERHADSSAGAGGALPVGAAVGGDRTTPADATAARPGGEAAQQGARLEVLAHAPLGGRGLNADVFLHRGFAYVGTWQTRTARAVGCPGTGVRVVDLADPRQPVEVSTLAAHPRTWAENMRVRSVRTPAFEGDLLAVGLQLCDGRPSGDELEGAPDAGGALSGVELWDVTNPRAPRWLGFSGVGPSTSGVHELDLVQRADGRVLALLAVNFSESEHPGQLGDFRIVDVTDPRAPVSLANWGAEAALGLGPHAGMGSDPDIFGHSARASADGMRAYVSYWDAGVVILDIADPAAPRLVGVTTFPPGAEGNAHSVALAQDGRLLVEASEVLAVDSSLLRVDSPPAVAGLVPAGGTLPAPPWPDTQSVSGPLAYVGRGCPAGDWEGDVAQGERVATADPYPTDPRGRIALLDRGACPASDKLERAHAAGAVGAVIVNTDDTPIQFESEDGPLGAFGIARTVGERLKGELAGGREVVVTLSAELVQYQDFGGLRFWDLSDPAAPRLISTYATSRTHVDPTLGPPERGVFSAHNPVVQGDLLFVSWYADGVRVLDIRDPAAPREVAAWMPPADAAPGAVRTSLGPDALVWGVAVDGDLVVASDVNSGLWVLRFVP
jgi:hypothetical protein